MAPVLQPFHLLAVIFAGWANRHQQRVIKYLLEENRTYTQQIRKRKLRLTNAQRARMAVKGKAFGRKVLNEVDDRLGQTTGGEVPCRPSCG